MCALPPLPFPGDGDCVVSGGCADEGSEVRERSGWSDPHHTGSTGNDQEQSQVHIALLPTVLVSLWPTSSVFSLASVY